MFVWLFLLCKQFHVFLFIFFPSVVHILAIKSNSDSDFDEDVNRYVLIVSAKINVVYAGVALPRAAPVTESTCGVVVFVGFAKETHH